MIFFWFFLSPWYADNSTRDASSDYYLKPFNSTINAANKINVYRNCRYIVNMFVCTWYELTSNVRDYYIYRNDTKIYGGGETYNWFLFLLIFYVFPYINKAMSYQSSSRKGGTLSNTLYVMFIVVVNIYPVTGAIPTDSALIRGIPETSTQGGYRGYSQSVQIMAFIRKLGVLFLLGNHPCF